VRGGAVGLDHEAPLPPQEVDLQAGDARVDARARQPEALDQGQKALLELRARERRLARRELGHDGPQDARAPAGQGVQPLGRDRVDHEVDPELLRHVAPDPDGVRGHLRDPPGELLLPAPPRTPRDGVRPHATGRLPPPRRGRS
jgi:hypothetical protein